MKKFNTFSGNNRGFSTLVVSIITATLLLITGGGFYIYQAIEVETPPSSSLSNNNPDFFTDDKTIATSSAASSDLVSNSTQDKEVGNISTSTSITYNQSLSKDDVVRQSIARGVSTNITEGISLKYEEFISPDLQRVTIDSKDVDCDTHDLTITPGEVYTIFCGSDKYNLKFFSYNSIDNMISFSLTTVTSTNNSDTNQPTSSNTVATSVNQESVTECTTEACINAEFEDCQPARLSASIEALGASVTYNILGRSESGACRVELVYTENPNPEWVDKPLVCDYDTSLTITEALTEALNSSYTDNQANCTGPLYEDVLQNF